MADEKNDTQQVSVAQAMATAKSLHREGQLDVAEKIYRRVLEAVPEYPDVMHFLGVLLHQRGRTDEALELIRDSISMAPATADWHNNLGNVLLEQGEAKEAREVYGRALELDPDLASAQLNMGNLLFRSGEVRGAVEHYNHALRLTPDNYNARRMLGISLSTLGHTEAAAEVYRRWLADEPDSPVARHLHAACTGKDMPDRAADELVEQLFDPFAEYFDEKLERLDYRAPALVGEAVARVFPNASGDIVCVDAGCGTGLCGLFLRPLSRRLTGVDLSEGMLKKARERSCYDELVKAELTQYLASRDSDTDLIVSSDTLVYFGNLSDVLEASRCALRPGGLLVFTVEQLAADGTEQIRLNHHGRYSHRKSYVLETLATAGFEPPEIRSAVIRTEAKQPVNGFVVSVRSPR